MANNKTRQYCSFCGRPDTEVGMLIAGVSGYICNECAEQAYEIAREAMQQMWNSWNGVRIGFRENDNQDYHIPHGRRREMQNSQNLQKALELRQLIVDGDEKRLKEQIGRASCRERV